MKQICKSFLAQSHNGDKICSDGLFQEFVKRQNFTVRLDLPESELRILPCSSEAQTRIQGWTDQRWQPPDLPSSWSRIRWHPDLEACSQGSGLTMKAIACHSTGVEIETKNNFKHSQQFVCNANLSFLYSVYYNLTNNYKNVRSDK